MCDDSSSVALTVIQHKQQILGLLTQDLDQKVEQALACPCLDDLKEGPCGTSFIAAFSCFLKSRADEKVCVPHTTHLVLQITLPAPLQISIMQQHCIVPVVFVAWPMQRSQSASYCCQCV